MVLMNKELAVVTVIGKKAGEYVEFGGLLGGSRIMPVSSFIPKKLVKRGGRIPAPMRSLTN